MDDSWMTAMSGVLGSLVGGSATVATAWISQRTANKREQLRMEIRSREALYGEFIVECSKILLDAFGHTLEKAEKLLPVYELVNRIRLVASSAVLAQAEHLLRHITEQYFSKNLTIAEIRELARSQDADPLKAFAEACRVELHAMRARI